MVFYYEYYSNLKKNFHRELKGPEPYVSEATFIDTYLLDLQGKYPNWGHLFQRDGEKEWIYGAPSLPRQKLSDSPGVVAVNNITCFVDFLGFTFAEYSFIKANLPVSLYQRYY